MATTHCKIFAHNRGDLVSTDGSADGKLSEDIQDYLDTTDRTDSAINLAISQFEIGQKVFTSVTVANAPSY
ncbi:MAG: hypothetical protein Unbinned2514contig1001_30 [Prokaryotic dsDNA virus sp.]|nr:MAG: hypothetical protein Unbinned2514contig1001_30 [Prokaryotic dsDNA virus sp.]|tara:strand:- start:569 stop:781 length:213 start_codon:yes stop_codon:yes gene_type:complete